jgi:hypothetical protein
MRGRRVCRLHGGKGGGPRAERNGAWRHGLRSQAVGAMRRRITESVRHAYERAKRIESVARWISAIARERRRARIEAREETPIPLFPPELQPGSEPPHPAASPPARGTSNRPCRNSPPVAAPLPARGHHVAAVQRAPPLDMTSVWALPRLNPDLTAHT